jgi:hypothetical protein
VFRALYPGITRNGGICLSSLFSFRISLSSVDEELSDDSSYSVFWIMS